MARIPGAWLAAAALALGLVGCAGMGTKRGQGAQIQRTAEPAPSLDIGALDARPELGQR